MDRREDVRQRFPPAESVNAHAANQHRPAREGWWQYVLSPCLILREAVRFAYSLFSPLTQGPARPPVRHRQRGSMFGNERHPQIFEGQLMPALNAANANYRFLLLYLHAPDHPKASETLNSLSNEYIVNFIDENFVFWVANLNEREGLALSRKLMPRSYPFFVVMTMVENQALPVETIGGESSPDALLSRFMMVLESKGSFLENLRAANQQVEIDRSLMADQNAELEEAMKADLDQQQEEERREEEERRAREDIERIEREEHEKRELEAINIQHDLSMKKMRLPQEPPEEIKDNVARLVFRLPGGIRLVRRFWAHNKIQSLYDFIDTQDTPLKANTYMLVIFPRREINDFEAPIESADLCPSASLEVKPL